MSKLSDRDLKVIYVVLMLVVAALAYFFGVKPNMEKRTGILDENTQLETRLNELRTKQANLQTVQDETAAMNASIKEKCNEFPSRTTSQVAYKMVDDLMKDSKIEVSSIALSMNDIFFAGSGDVAAVIEAQEAGTDAAAQEAGTDAAAGDAAQTDASTTEGDAASLQDTSIQLEDLIGYRSSVTLAFEGKPAEIQKAVEFIKASSSKGERMTLGNISLAFDSGSGGLTGSMIIYMYALEGNQKPFENPKFGNIKHGMSDMFGAFD